MKTKAILLLATTLLLAAVPSFVISYAYGGCCARVGGVCISSCKKVGGCTGNGDCVQTWTTASAASLTLTSAECPPATLLWSTVGETQQDSAALPLFGNPAASPIRTVH